MREVFAGFDVEVVDVAAGARPGLDAPLAREFVAAVGAEPRPKYGWTDVARFSRARRAGGQLRSRRPAPGAPRRGARPARADRRRRAGTAGVAERRPDRRDRAARRWSALPAALRVGILYFAARVVTTAFLFAAASCRAFGSRFGPKARTSATSLLGWDAQWYWFVADNGYPAELPLTDSGAVAENAWAFMPVYAYLAKGLGAARSDRGGSARCSISVVAGYSACLVLYRMMRMRMRPTTSAMWAVVFFACGAAGGAVPGRLRRVAVPAVAVPRALAAYAAPVRLAVPADPADGLHPARGARLRAVPRAVRHLALGLAPPRAARRRARSSTSSRSALLAVVDRVRVAGRSPASSPAIRAPTSRPSSPGGATGSGDTGAGFFPFDGFVQGAGVLVRVLGARLGDRATSCSRHPSSASPHCCCSSRTSGAWASRLRLWSRELSALPARGVLPAVEHLPPAPAALAAVGGGRDAALDGVAGRRAGRVSARASGGGSTTCTPSGNTYLADPVSATQDARAIIPACPVACGDKLDTQTTTKGSHDGSHEAENRRRADGGREGGSPHHRAGAARGWRSPRRLGERR